MPLTAGWTGVTRPGRCCRITRGELLIAPANAFPAHVEAALARRLGQTLDAPRRVQVTCGRHLILILAPDGLAGLHVRPSLEHLSITEGLWPEPLGLHLTLSTTPPNPSWTLESDRYGIRPIFYGLDQRHRPIVSTRPELVAAIIGGRLSAQSVAEQLLVGFTLDSHSLFEGVRRLRPHERLSHSDERGFAVSTSALRRPVPGDQPHDWIAALQPTIVDAFERGAALELSGGVDSRLVLAIGLHGGAKPRVAFTLGGEVGDAPIARQICERHHIEHVFLPVEIDRARLAADGLRFAARAGFEVSACSHAWLPRVLERLASIRAEQIGGGGGKCAAGFYGGPFDALCALRPVREAWVRNRLFKSGVDAADIFGPIRGRALTAEVTGDALRLLRMTHGRWRHRTDELYLTQRVPHAGGAVLSASACWYQPCHPLLHEPHIEWGRTLDPARRAQRRLRMKIIRDLDAGLGGIPYSSHRRYGPGPGARLRQRIGALRSAAGKVRRGGARQRAVPDLGAATVASALAWDESVRRSLWRLAERGEMDIRPEHLERMLGTPAAWEHELGALVTAAWAAEAADAVSSDLRRADFMRRAA
ncbi:MAG: hypothetical protein ACYS0G_13090 [Planctomycetota bacterium]